MVIIQYSSRNTGTAQLENDRKLNKLKIQQTQQFSCIERSLKIFKDPSENSEWMYEENFYSRHTGFL